MSVSKVILDCDPGHDDAVALLLALASSELDVLGVTTTYGNVSVDATTRNALALLELARSDVPVHAGANRPLLRERLNAEHVHGTSGVGGVTLPEPSRDARPGHAAQFIIDTVMTHPGEVTLVPTGALTNVALALRLEPRLAGALRQVVLMGGSTGAGNITPSAEFNVACDPHAARIVFESGVPLVMFGLNVTHQVIATPERVARLRDLGNHAGAVVAELLEHYKQFYARHYGWSGAAVHDACTVAYLLRPELFRTRALFVEVDVSEGPGFGRTICDVHGVTGRAANAHVALEADADGVFDLLAERLARLP